MSLSNYMNDNNAKDSESWQPLIPRLLEKVEEKDAMVSEPLKREKKKKKDNFQKIYDHKPGDGESDEFIPIYTREEEKDAIEKTQKQISDTLSKNESRQTTADAVAEKKEPETAPAPLETQDQNATALAEAVEKEAYERGFAQGKEEGLASGKKEAEHIVVHLNGILSEIQHLWQNLVKRYEKEIMELVCHAVEKIVYGRVSIDNDIVKKAILHAFEKIPHPVDVTININPEDYEYIEVIKEEILEEVKALKNVVVVANPAVDRGGCKVETKSGEVDTSVFDRLEAIKKSILEAGGVGT